MENVSVKNKEKVDLVTISGGKDILYYIGQYMGAEFAECAERNLKEDLYETREKYEILQNELDSYGASLESMNLLMHDTMDALDEIIEDVQTSKRLYKEKLLDELKNLRKNIYNEL